MTTLRRNIDRDQCTWTEFPESSSEVLALRERFASAAEVAKIAETVADRFAAAAEVPETVADRFAAAAELAETVADGLESPAEVPELVHA